MRIPGLSLRMPRLSSLRLPAGGGRVLLYGVYTLVLFLIFMVVNFPHHILVRRALDSLNRGPLRVEVKSTRFAWWNGYELGGFRLVKTDPSLPPLLESSRLYVRPGLSGLFEGRPDSVLVKGKFYQGDVTARWARRRGGSRVIVDLKKVRLGLYPWLLDQLDEGLIDGELSGLVSVTPRAGAALQVEGDIALASGAMTGVKVRGFSIPDLRDCVADAKLSMKDRRLEVESVVLACAEPKLTVTGQITTRTRFADSLLNLKLQNEPGSEPSEGWKNLSSLIPCGMTGTISRPRSQLCGAGRRRR